MKKITILFAFRNRDALRVKLCLQSLEEQTVKGFEVVFVDYGSDAAYSIPVKEIVEGFAFASYQYIAHPGLLWNKSKALNYGISQAQGDFIFIADVDILFHPEAVALFTSLAVADKAFLFTLSYLTKNALEKTNTESDFESFEVKHTGSVNGMVLASKASLEQINGFDEFFHFYGSEDVDVFQRLENSGIVIEHRLELYFKHQWHPIYNSYDDTKFSVSPRLFNIKRINQQHYLRHKEMQITTAKDQEEWGTCYGPEDQNVLSSPDITLRLPNIAAKVDHFLQCELHGYSGKVVSVTFFEDNYTGSLKYKVKKILGKQSQPYLSMKEVNDAVLKEIIFRYRHYNYSFKVSEDLKEIVFIIVL